jgi:1-phosphofructokinase family hexose kinase
MIVTVTLNPTLDKALAVPELRPGELHRARMLREDAGGKGINVSRALRAVGVESVITGFVGGATGRRLREALEAHGYDCRFVEVAGETRQNITLLDEAAGIYTKINEPGAAITPMDLVDLRAILLDLARPDAAFAFCGSLPPGAPEDAYAYLIDAVQSAGAYAFLDTSGAALRYGLEAEPFVLKPNAEEAAELLGRAIVGDEGYVAAVRDLAPFAAVCLTRGADGLVFRMGDEIFLARAPLIAARSPVGAGDATLAGLLWALEDGVDLETTVRRAAACGTAAAMQEGTGVGERELVESLLPQVEVTHFGAS